jgi:hypothetical protein
MVGVVGTRRSSETESARSSEGSGEAENVHVTGRSSEAEKRSLAREVGRDGKEVRSTKLVLVVTVS